MAHGLPDWYRGVDIAYQALSELITRPTYGGAIGSSGSKTVYANNTVTLINISGQGMIYGIYVRVSHTATQRDSGVRLELDSNLLFDESFADLNTYGISYPRGYPLTLSKYDDTNFDYCVLIPYGLTFESLINLRYREEHGRTPDVYYSVVYALI